MEGLLLAFIVVLCVFLLTVSAAFCWKQRTYIKAYKNFQSHRLDTKFLLKVILRRGQEKVPFTSVFFQAFLEPCRKFQKEGLCVVWLAFQPYIVIYNEYLTKIFSNEVTAIDKSSLYNNIKEGFGDGLLGSDGALWRVHRKLLNPAFSLGVLKGKVHIFNQNAEHLVQELQSFMEKPVEDVEGILKRCSFNIMAESILGLNLYDKKYESKAENYMKVIDRGTELAVYRAPRPWLQWRFLLPLSSKGRLYMEIVDKVHLFTYEIIDDLKKFVLSTGNLEKNLESDVEVRKSLAQILIEQHLQDPTFTMENVRDHVVNFMAAGHDTTCYTMMWCLYLLGHHPEVQEKACKEIESVVIGKDVTYNDLGQLKYLECILKETLRLYTIVPIFGRKLSKEIHCGQYTMPKGADVLFCPFILHRNPDVFPDPEVFKPERFSSGSDIRPSMHIPFAEGYRNCIGKRFAMMEMKVLLVHVLQRFELKSLSRIVEDQDLNWAIVLKPTKPLPILFKIRQP